MAEKKVKRKYLQEKTSVLSIRMSPSNKELFREMAEDHQMTSSDFLLYLMDCYMTDAAKEVIRGIKYKTR